MKIAVEYNINIKGMSLKELDAAIEEMTMQRDKLRGIVQMEPDARIEFFRIAKYSKGVIDACTLYKKVYCDSSLDDAKKFVDSL